MRTAVSCKIPVLLCRDLPPGAENGPQSSPNKILSVFAPLMVPSTQGPLTKKKATINVYLDAQVMGSNPRRRSQSYKESPKSHLRPITYLMNDPSCISRTHKVQWLQGSNILACLRGTRRRDLIVHLSFPRSSPPLTRPVWNLTRPVWA